ncbi:NADPH-dependent FMN reductase [Pseudomonas aeruginosa]|uniref:NADPH-dependent FMN reductase n=1 Tax=Pseudomonas aeruginosa TaxID=287 RepID=UPI000EB290E9|nr:NAD(P)H-dependent oxidoreductase [Pseudomonas aeruginosa]HBO3146290.1 NAD(P)H-dependent oxidoreductase [Pseudomonas aeruginosa]HCL4166284.1 NAD(P)H-dependent oxidoreductase [Pseudomonas aeruginosa]
MQRVRLVGIAGSIRAASAHGVILRTISEELLPEDCELVVRSLHDIPLYNEDLDGALSPASVTALRQAVADADGLLIGSPEYNHGMSGVLKNALDWLSRPHGQSVLKDKPVLTFTASPAFTGGVRAQQQLNETLWAIPAALLAHPQVVIGGVASKIVEGRLTDEPARSFLAGALCQLRAKVLGASSGS